MIKYIFALAFLFVFMSCDDTEDILTPSQYVYVRNASDVTLRVIEEHPDYYDGIIVESINPGSLCDTVSGSKRDFYVCLNCIDNCK